MTKLYLSDDILKVELMLRQAQQEGSAVSSLTGNYGGAGVYFSTSTPRTVFSFKDIIDTSIIRAIGVGNGVYDSLPINEKNEVFTLNARDYISKLCVASSSTGPFYCNASVLVTMPPINALTISFTRPKQTAHIYIDTFSNVDYSYACIEFRTTSRLYLLSTKSLYVYKSGMITKKGGSCT
jgi:hypothetical protein